VGRWALGSTGLTECQLVKLPDPDQPWESWAGPGGSLAFGHTQTRDTISAGSQVAGGAPRQERGSRTLDVSRPWRGELWPQGSGPAVFTVLELGQ